MRRFAYTIAALIVLATGCREELPGSHTTHPGTFTAVIESFDQEVKTTMDSDRRVVWTKGDQIAIFRGRTYAEIYRITDSSAGSASAEFVSNTGEASAPGDEFDSNVAIYPYMESLICSESDSESAAYHIHNLTIPAIQEYHPDGFASGVFPMVAVTEGINDQSMSFKNVMGGLRLQLKGTDKVRNITVEGRNGESLAGKATVTGFSDGRTPVISISENVQTAVQLDCGKGVQLKKDRETSFIIVLPPVHFSKGFTVTVTTSDGTVKTIQTSATTNQIKRSSLLRMPAVDLDEITAEVHVKYTETLKDIANPERGFYYARSSSYPLSASDIQKARLSNVTLFHIGYKLTEFMESYISDDFLQRIRNEMQLLRDGGAKCILRFSYKDSADESDKPWDATPEWVERHIRQLKPILQEYGDVIMCFQAGFIGVWGEWYYTDNFVFNPKNPQEHALRKAVVESMLDALPTDRSVALRTPAFKRMMYADSYADTLTIETAYDGSARARLSCFNDCFGASGSDSGTFSGEESREYWKNETRYVFMGGETCAVSDYCRCSISIKDMEDYHWSYLNFDYNRDVIDRWQEDGCMDQIRKRLGYRLVLTDVHHPSKATAGNGFNIRLKIHNTGFAAPMNGRDVEVILVDGNGKKTVWDCTDIDPRHWFAGQTATIDKAIIIPEDAAGRCTLYLNLPDPKPTLHDNPMFSIRLANDGIWSESDGYNKIAEFDVTKPASGEDSSDDSDGFTSTGEDITFGDDFNPWR
jgi:hypothetical protein